MHGFRTHTFRWLRMLTLGAAVALALSACDWTMSGYNAARTFDNTSESSLTTSNVGQLSLRFGTLLGSFDPAPSTDTSPAVANGSVYVAGDNGGLSVYDAAGVKGCTGDLPPACDAPLWTAAVPAATQHSSPTVVNGTVYLGGSDGKVYAFDAKGVTSCVAQDFGTRCSPLRTYAAGGPVASSPAVVNNILYVTAGPAGRTLYAFDAVGTTSCSGTPTSCAPLWSATLGGVASDPTVAAGQVYVGAGNGKIYAFDAAGATSCSGSPLVCAPLWTATLSGASSSISTPAYANGVLYATSADGRLYAVSATGTSCSGTPVTCAPLWRSSVSTRASAPAVGPNTVYSATPGGIQAFDAAGQSGCTGTPKTCTPLWTATGTTADTPAIANGVLYVGEQAGALKAFDAAGVISCSGAPKTCQPLWADGVSKGTPVIANGTVYSRSQDQTGCCLYRYLLAYSLVPPQIKAATFYFADGKVPVEGIGFPRSTNGVVTVTDNDQSNEVASTNFTTRTDGSFYDVEVNLPVWQCGDHISATVTVGAITASDQAILQCPG